MKKCPFCAEEIQTEAIKCKFCSSDLTTPEAKTKLSEQIRKEKAELLSQAQREAIEEKNKKSSELHERIVNRSGDSEKLKKYLLKHKDSFDKLEQKSNDEINNLADEEIRKKSILWIYIVGIFVTFYSISILSVIWTILSFSVIVSIWLHPRKWENILMIKERIRNFRSYKLRSALSLFLILFISLMIAWARGAAEQKAIQETENKKQELIKQKQTEEENRKIEEDKKNYITPIIDIKSWTGLQKTSSYILNFSVTWAENVKVNNTTLSGTNGSYSFPIKIENPDMNIKIFANNKYYSNSTNVSISRQKTKSELEANKMAELEKKAKERVERIKAKNEQAAKLFSWWDGSLSSLVKVTKSVMNDPDSFEHVSTTWMVQENEKTWDTLRVRMNYRGKNAFWGTVTNSVLVETDFSGNILKVLE